MSIAQTRRRRRKGRYRGRSTWTLQLVAHNKHPTPTTTSINRNTNNRKLTNYRSIAMEEVTSNHTVSDEELKDSSHSTQSERKSSGDSGYNSDVGVDNATSEDTTSEEGQTSESEPFPFSSESSSCDEEEDMDAQIEYLGEKQKLLKRASHVLACEEAYTASNALFEVYQRKEDAIDSIWSQAREYLELQKNQGDEGGGTASETACMPPPPTSPTRIVKLVHSPRDPSIDVSQVECTTSKKYQDGYSDSTAVSGPSSLLQELSPVNMFRDGQWMAQALVWSTQKSTGKSSSSANKLSKHWRVISDPQTCTLGLMPPSDLSMKDSVCLEEAITMTDEPRLVAQSTPPFCVVYVNKAFLVLAGLKSSRNIIGKPIESVVQVTQEINGQRHESRYLESELLLSQSSSSKKRKACRIRVVPVVDRSKRRRLANHHHRRSSASYMSHILVPVLGGAAAAPVLAVQAPRRVVAMTTIAVVESSDESDTTTPPSNNTVYGTVG
jgi:hypothetical protein